MNVWIIFWNVKVLWFNIVNYWPILGHGSLGYNVVQIVFEKYIFLILCKKIMQINNLKFYKNTIIISLIIDFYLF